MIRRLVLSLVSVCALGLLAAACSGEDGGGGSNALEGGLYEFTIASVTEDTCWPEQNQVPPEGVAAIDLLVTATDDQVTLSPNPAARFYFQPLSGVRDGDDLFLEGNGVLTTGTGYECSVAVLTSGFGEVIEDGVFEMTLTADLDADTTEPGASNGCGALSGETWPGATIPFPTLSEPTNGTCSVTYSGTAVVPE